MAASSSPPPCCLRLGSFRFLLTGGLSGIFLGQPVLDLYLHDTYFVVAHFHLIMGVAAIFGIFSAIFYWFPLVFGRMLNETLGKLHFFATFIGVYCLFLPMHVAGVAGNPRRYPDFTNFEFLAPLLTMHQFMTWAAFFTASAQVVFLVNLFWSMRRGRQAPPNPWSADTLEWNGQRPATEATEGDQPPCWGRRWRRRPCYSPLSAAPTLSGGAFRMTGSASPSLEYCMRVYCPASCGKHGG